MCHVKSFAVANYEKVEVDSVGLAKLLSTFNAMNKLFEQGFVTLAPKLRSAKLPGDVPPSHL